MRRGGTIISPLSASRLSVIHHSGWTLRLVMSPTDRILPLTAYSAVKGFASSISCLYSSPPSSILSPPSAGDVCADAGGLWWMPTQGGSKPLGSGRPDCCEQRGVRAGVAGRKGLCLNPSLCWTQRPGVYYPLLLLLGLIRLYLLLSYLIFFLLSNTLYSLFRSLV